MSKQLIYRTVSRYTLLLLQLGGLFISFSSARALSIELVTTFTYPGASDTTPTAINDRGEVTGSFATNHDLRGFVRKADGSFLSPLIEPNDQDGVTVPTGINHSRLICGYFRSGPVHTEGFFLRGKAYTEFDVSGSFNGTWIYGVNNAGDFIGYYDTAGGGKTYAFVSVGGNLTTFNIPNGTAYGTSPAGINNLGQVVGNYEDRSGGNSYSFGFYRDAEGNLTYPIAFAPNTDTTLNGINDAFLIVGSYGTRKGLHGVLMNSSNEVVTYDYPGANATVLTGINNKGQICGWYKVGLTTPAVGFLAQVGGE